MPVYTQRQKITSSERIVDIDLKDDFYEYMIHHVIDGRNLIPATGYLIMAWETMSMLEGKLFEEVSVVFEDVRFVRATTIPKEGAIQLIVMVHRGKSIKERWEVILKKFEVSKL